MHPTLDLHQGVEDRGHPARGEQLVEEAEVGGGSGWKEDCGRLLFGRCSPLKCTRSTSEMSGLKSDSVISTSTSSSARQADSTP